MKTKSYLMYTFLFLLIVTGCKQKESTATAQPKVDIYLPTQSANVVFHIKDNKVTSYEILNEDGSPITEELVYRQISVTGEEKCYRCPPGQTDTKNCNEIPCPVDPCKEIYCGPLNFELYDADAPSGPDKVTKFSIIANGIKK